jgi:hypothetical protein
MQFPVLGSRALVAVVDLLFSALVLAGAGCGGKARKPVFPVKGQVLVNNKPAAHAVVIFHPLEESEPRPTAATAETEADGTFKLSTYTAGDGAHAGSYVVSVTWPERTGASGGDADAAPDRLGGRYANPKTSKLQAQVREGPNDLPPFQLTK